eukprot:3868354-Rhodomonas_salina.1
MILPESERGGLGIEEEEERRLDSEPLLQGTGAGEQLEPVYDRFGSGVRGMTQSLAARACVAGVTRSKVVLWITVDADRGG